MIKSIFFLGLSLLFFAADAQKNDKEVYYVMHSGALATSTANADFMLVISPPDSAAGNKLFVVREFYPNGKIRLIGSSSTKTYENLKLQGVQITFFPNRRRMRVSIFKDSKPIGNVIEYYPNGKLYNIKSYVNEKNIFLKQCNDSTGRVIAENGNGNWLEFLDETFKGGYTTGKVENGQQEGQWLVVTGEKHFSVTYQKGEKVSSTYSDTQSVDQQDDPKKFRPVEIVPDFPGGMEGFGKFIERNLRYPATARANNTHGRVIVTFVVERDGSLTDLKVARGIGDGCDEEALRIIKSSPKWKPGYQDGKPVRVAYSVPIAFTLSN
jgi:TonB family protein